MWVNLWAGLMRQWHYGEHASEWTRCLLCKCNVFAMSHVDVVMWVLVEGCSREGNQHIIIVEGKPGGMAGWSSSSALWASSPGGKALWVSCPALSWKGYTPAKRPLEWSSGWRWGSWCPPQCSSAT